MKILKRMMIVLGALTIISANVKAMGDYLDDQGELIKLESDYPRQQRAETQSVYQGSGVPSGSSWFNVLDGLIQAASIYSVDNTNSKVVQGLAGARIGVNAINIFVKFCAFLNSFPDANVFDVASSYFRGKNVLEDVNNYKNANAIASQNLGKRNNEKLKNKQYCQYAWLALNKVLSFRWEKDSLIAVLSEFSELYRRKMMYEMISKQKAS